MVTVLVTGASGTLGSRLVERLVAHGHDVRAVRHRSALTEAPGMSSFRADVLSGEGLEEAARGAEVIVHAATSAQKRASKTELAGARHVAKIAQATGAHLVYPSIVGIDRIGGTYYAAKRAAEDIIAGCPAWTIQRATQFHPTLDAVLRHGVFPATRHLSFQPVDAGEVADEIVATVERGPRGRAKEFGGPAVRTLRDLVTARRAIAGRRTVLLRVPAVGPFRELDRGANLCPDQARGMRSWEDWLARDSAGVGRSEAQ